MFIGELSRLDAVPLMQLHLLLPSLPLHGSFFISYCVVLSERAALSGNALK